jgi:4-amino-4-deoxy-L-arabinose transferase-like glycosyltransferase
MIAPVSRLRPAIVLPCLLALALVLRVTYFVELDRSPCIHQDRWEQTDMHFFDVWAKRIVAGDWLTREPFHPFLDWHLAIAQAWFRMHPEAAVAPGATGPAAAAPADPTTAARALWDRWYGERTFHQEPLYAWLVALTYAVFGPDVQWVFSWQMLVGAGSVALIWALARRQFGDATAALAGLMAALCGPLLFYELVLLRSSFMVFAGLALALLADLAFERRRPGWWMGLGVALGATLLLNSTFALFGAGLVVLIAWEARRTRGPGVKAMARPTAGLVVGAALALSPAVARNLVVGASPLSLSSIGPLAFVCSNTPDFDPRNGFFLSMEHVPRIMGETEGRALPAAIETLRTHAGAGSYLRLLGRKTDWAWRWYEMPNNKNFYYYRLHAPVLAWMPVTFLIVAPLGVVGMILAAVRGKEPDRRRPLAPLFLLVGASFLPLIIFYPLSRFRAGLIASLIPFAAFALADIARRLGERRWASAGTAAAGTVLVALMTARPLPVGMPLIRPIDWMAAHFVDYIPRAQAAEARGDWSAAADVIAESLRYMPPIVDSAGPGHPARDANEAGLLRTFIPVVEQEARLLAQAGRMDEAAAVTRRAAELRAALGAGTAAP